MTTADQLQAEAQIDQHRAQLRDALTILTDVYAREIRDGTIHTDNIRWCIAAAHLNNNYTPDHLAWLLLAALDRLTREEGRTP